MQKSKHWRKNPSIRDEPLVEVLDGDGHTTEVKLGLRAVENIEVANRVVQLTARNQLRQEIQVLAVVEGLDEMLGW